MIAIARPFDGITLNEQLEYVLTDDGEVMKFESEDKAKGFLRDHGMSEEIIRYLIFEEVR